METSSYPTVAVGEVAEALQRPRDIPWREQAESQERRLIPAVADLDSFLASVERQALRIAWHYTGDRDEALDLVQDAMLRLAHRYSRRPAEEWTPLFYRILRNRVRDWQRRQVVRNRVFFWRAASDAEDTPDPIDLAADLPGRGPEDQNIADHALVALDGALRQLPARQREAFLLRTLDGVDVAAAAQIMRISQGSVKTHYSRAIRRLRDLLGEHWHG